MVKKKILFNLKTKNRPTNGNFESFRYGPQPRQIFKPITKFLYKFCYTSLEKYITKLQDINQFYKIKDLKSAQYASTHSTHIDLVESYLVPRYRRLNMYVRY